MSRRRWVTLGVVAGLATGCSSAAEEQTSRSDRVALAERRMWDRYGSLDSSAVETTSEAAAIADMIAHHTDAIDGALTLLANNGIDPDVRAFAERIVRVQRDQVATMQAWLDGWYPDVEIVSHWSPMFADPATTADEQAFLSTMIEHHEHAIVMYAGWVTAGLVTHDELGVLAARIARGQEGEIATMRQLAVVTGQVSETS